MPAVQETIDQVRQIDVDQYKYGFETVIESDTAPKGLNEDTIRMISAKKNEPEWMLEWRLDAFKRWLTLDEPTWARVDYPKIDFQDIHYYSAPKGITGPKSIDDVDPELLRVYEKLGIPLREQEILAGVQQSKIAVDAVFDSVSVVTTFKEELSKAGVIFMSISEAMREYPELVQKYIGTVVPVTDNYYATLNSAVFTDGSFVYVPKGVRCPMELSTYFRINEKNTGQFERTLIIAEEGAYVSLSRGLHRAAARRKPAACRRGRADCHGRRGDQVLDGAELVSRATRTARAAIYNFVTKRGDCRGDRLEDLLDPGRNRIGDHLEIPVLHPARR